MRIDTGRYTVRLAESEDDVAAAQALRFRVFVEEMGATPSPEDAALKRERDRFDPHCDHLLLFDNGPEDAPFAAPEIAGVYRLLRSSVAKGVGDVQGPGFYTSGEYDLAPVERFDGETMELGRSCVAADYRGGGAMQLLWMALSQYIVIHQISVMFGTASFHGSTIEPLKVPLAFLWHNCLAPEAIRPRALPEHYVDMNLLPPEEAPRAQAMRQMPALMKGYLRLSGFVGDGAFIDRDFNTVDVCLVMDTEKIGARYKKFYARRAPADIARVLG